MKAQYEQHWHEVAQEVLLEMRTWREEHPKATLQEIEEEVDTRIARMRAGLVEGIAMSSATVEVGGRAGRAASVRQITEQAGAAQVQVQAAEVETLLSERPESPAGPEVQLMSLDGALNPAGDWGVEGSENAGSGDSQ